MAHVEDRWFRKDGTPKSRCGKGKRYRERGGVDGRERGGTSYDRKQDATRRKIEREADLLRGTWVDPTDRTTVVQYARMHAAVRPHGKRTAERVESMIRNHLEPTALGGRRLAAVRPSEAQAWVTDRAQHLAPTTLRVLVGMVRSTYNAAVLDRLVAGNPFARVTLPRHESERIVPLTVDQVRELAGAMAPRYRALVLTQAGLGLRIGECLALRVDDVDFLRRTVRIEHQATQASRELVPPKTPRSRRTVPLPGMVADVLAAHLAAFPASDPVGCGCPPAVACSRLRAGLVFHTSTGRPYAAEHYGLRVFRAAVQRAKLPAGTTTHDLRHAFASWLLAAGESVVAVAERLGHTNASLVVSVYGHLMPDSEDRTRRAMDAAWSGDSEPGTAQGRPR